MKKNKIKKINTNLLDQIKEKRTGGQNALNGYDYQLLYSCYTLLSFLDTNEKTVKLEGIEDLDTYSGLLNNNEIITHIQLKQSLNKQNASFLKKVFKNFIEVYLIEPNRYFKLVYDFMICDGNLKKLIDKTLDHKSYIYFENIINQLKNENSNWNWQGFDLNIFLSHLYFENIEKDNLALKIEQLLIAKFDITTGNEKLFVNSLHFLCYEKMVQGESIALNDLAILVQNTKDDISKGIQNPAYKWINKIDFDNLQTNNKTFEYYDGKKAEPIDIVQKLPVRRELLEKEILDSIVNNTITVIKSSSGQGKTTLALQAAFNMKDNYSIYKLRWCEDTKEISNIANYFTARIKVGEKLLIILDNLDAQLKDWNQLAQLLSEQISINYKILITTREDDWKLYSGPESDLKSLNIVGLELNSIEAEKIYNNLKILNKLNKNIKNWQSCWEAVSERKLLIEYIYLLTHGQMLAKRIDEQIKKLQNDDGNVKCDILRLVCLADTIGIKLPVRELVETLNSSTNKDISIVIESLEKEFYIRFNEENIYIEGLHPVRSEHIVERLHLYVDRKDTLKKLLKIVDDKYVSKLYSVLPSHINNDKENFYKDLVDFSKKKNLKFFLNSLDGLFSGTVNAYYQQHKSYFDKANSHYGLELFEVELNPFSKFEEVNEEIKPISSVYEMMPDNKNISDLYNLYQTVEPINLKNTDIYIYAKYLFQYLNKNFVLDSKKTSAKLISWLINFNSSFNLLSHISFEQIWDNSGEWGVENLSELMYCWFLVDKEKCHSFIKKNKVKIIKFLKEITSSIKLYENDDGRQIHVEYILSPTDINIANKLSVERLEIICKMLPIYEIYCSDSIKPKIDALQAFEYPDDSHKEMPFRNLVISFHYNFAQLWGNTILSNYEFSSTYEWLLFWSNTRRNIRIYIENFIKILEKRLNNKFLTEKFNEDFIKLSNDILNQINCSNFFPGEKKLFKKESTDFEEAKDFKNKYFMRIANFINQGLKIIGRTETDIINLAIINLKNAQKECLEMQQKYNTILEKSQIHIPDNQKNSLKEIILLERLENYIMFYLENTIPSDYNRNYIEKWNEQRKYSLIKNIKECLLQNNKDSFDYVFPNKIIEEGGLKTLPLLINDVNIYSDIDQEKIFYSLSNLADCNIHYIFLMFLKDGLVFNIGLRVYLNDLNKYIDNTKFPFPIEIESNILNCFSEKFHIISKASNGMEGIDILFIKFWEFAQYKKHLTETSDKKYLKDLQENKKNEIHNYWQSIKNKIPADIVQDIEKSINNVCEKKEEFGDDKLNELYNALIYNAICQST